MTKMHTEETDLTETMNHQELNRRSFLYSLGALALTASAAPRLLAQTAGFAHPGLLHTQADFQRMAANLNNELWKSGWARLLASPTGRNWIGRSQRSGEPNLKGRIDDFRIYHGALSAAQAGAVMYRQPL